MNTPITARAIVAEAREAERKGANMGSIRKILIVDDSATERHMLNDMLTKAGFDVVSTDNGEDAIVKARQVKPDLILMDVVMPGLNGFQATRAISRDPETKLIPVIMCTSKSQETDKIWGLRQGARDYVVKPVNREELLAKHGVDYTKTPAEDFATGIVTFLNPESGQRVQGQFTVSWMYDKQGLRLMVDGLGPDTPVFEDPAAHGYYREEGGGMMVGLFEPRAAAWHPEGVPAGSSFTKIQPDWDRMGPFLETAMSRVPVTLEAGGKITIELEWA